MQTMESKKFVSNFASSTGLFDCTDSAIVEGTSFLYEFRHPWIQHNTYSLYLIASAYIVMVVDIKHSRHRYRELKSPADNARPDIINF